MFRHIRRVLSSAWPVLLTLILLPPLLAEFFLRAKAAVAGPSDYFIRQGVDLHGRVWRLWLRERSDAPGLNPPYPVYANRDWADEERLKTVAASSKFPPGTTVPLQDFLVSDVIPSSFTVSVNSIGFRDRERLPGKRPGVFRILCLGSYMTYGLGVEQADTFPAKLEKELNSRGKGSFEVWNMGRPSGTAIIGFSLLKLEAEKYKPDLVILEYGMVDRSIVSDNLLLSALQFPRGAAGMTSTGKFLREAAGTLLFNSHLLRGLWKRLFNLGREKKLASFTGVMSAALDLCASMNIPAVILIPNHPGVSRKNYSALEGRAAAVMEVRQIYSETPPSAEQEAAFYSAANWTSEWPRLDRDLRRFAPYQANIYHPGPLGQELVARRLAPVVLKLSGERRP